MKPDATLNVTLKVDEKNVTGETIPVTVEKVTKIDDGSDVTTKGLTYYWYIKGMAENELGNSYIFTELDEKKSYTLGCKIVSEAGDSGTSEVTVISFGMKEPSGGETRYFRATEGMTWSEWGNSHYPTGWSDVSGEANFDTYYRRLGHWGTLRRYRRDIFLYAIC